MSTDPSQAIAAAAAAAQTAGEVGGVVGQHGGNYHLQALEQQHLQQQQQQQQQQHHEQHHHSPHNALVNAVLEHNVRYSNNEDDQSVAAHQQLASTGIMKTNNINVVNKCRRCKKKRPEDEPMETARYRTCKPCREIERKKKRVKKAALKGETLPPDFDQIPTQQPHQPPQQPQLHQPPQQPSHQTHENNVDVERDLMQIANQVRNNGLSQIHQYLPHDQQQQLKQQLQQQLQQEQQHQLQQQHHQQQQVQLQHVHDDKEIPIDDSLLRQGVEDDEDETNIKDDEDSKKVLANEANAEAFNPASSIHGSNARTMKSTKNEPTTDNDASNLFAEINQKESQPTDQEVKAPVATAAATTNTNISTTSVTNEEERRCLYCNEIRSINDNGRYQLCEDCVDNPLRKDNVYDDLNLYLDKISKNKNEDLKNVIYISKFQQKDGVISDLDFNQPNLNPIINDLNEKFINPLITKSGFKFSKSSSNLAVKPYPKTIKLLFKCKQDIKTIQKGVNPSPVNSSNSTRKMKTENCSSNVYVSYDIFAKTLSIKFNHLSHLTFIEKLYSKELIDKISELLLNFGNEDLIKSNINDNGNLSNNEQNEQSLNKVFNFIKDDKFLSSSEVSSALKIEINNLKKINFLKDFSNF
ncbi:hypothetical protein WICMUC_004297 [Wickerhamomyces mucosus]|uniref:Uncharacterized protein n=1 Tax=Wickerhamomyces mucosus TaxID=1378264 RepID=A0A9P8PHY1_9ASCO|nr:hypothetical protein WICMUC_004297 [Wickerhamomyces mucosus]